MINLFGIDRGKFLIPGRWSDKFGFGSILILNYFLLYFHENIVIYIVINAAHNKISYAVCFTSKIMGIIDYGHIFK